MILIFFGKFIKLHTTFLLSSKYESTVNKVNSSHEDISVKNIDRIYHATLNSHNLSSTCPYIMIVYVLESLLNFEQLCYKHLELIYHYQGLT